MNADLDSLTEHWRQFPECQAEIARLRAEVKEWQDTFGPSVEAAADRWRDRRRDLKAEVGRLTQELKLYRDWDHDDTSECYDPKHVLMEAVVPAAIESHVYHRCPASDGKSEPCSLCSAIAALRGRA